MDHIRTRLAAVRRRILEAEKRFGRAPGSVKLLAVSKTFGPEAVAEAMEEGQRAFGENYLQEALAKIEALRERAPQWHFIGAIQSNKTRDIARHFDWVHTVDRLKIARRLSEQRPDELAPLNVCLQINISGEASKSGAAPEQAGTLAAEIAALPRLKLRGLMAIPAREEEFERQRAAFARLRTLKEEIEASGLPLDTLSMGMSNDLEAAIAEGATLVRVGSAIFGPRTQRP